MLVLDVRWKHAATVSPTVIVIAVVMEVGCGERVMVARSEQGTNVRFLAVSIPLRLATRYRRCCGFPWYCRLRSSHHLQLRLTLPHAVHPLTLAESDGACISGSSARIEYTETSCRTLSLFLRSCCRQLVCGLPTWVLSLAAGDPLRYSGCGRGRCNASVIDR